ncbi:hypothetical protein BDF21DRAFT_158697 [Thamnidium elegans]|nr:hypothetical protein BDF21DRAFT_158697 [Thamnidium elegans]
MSTPTLIGVPFSTYTRTIRMVFMHMGQDYKLEQTLPHSKSAYKYNPFGRVPSLLHNEKAIFETSAIRDYIDTVFGTDLTPKDLETRLLVDQMISVLSDYIFHHVVFGISKPRDQYEKEAVDSMVKGPFLCGDELTWADYFMYPAMADLYSLPERDFFVEKGPKLFSWYQMFEKRKEVVETYDGTVADIRKSKSSL